MDWPQVLDGSVPDWGGWVDGFNPLKKFVPATSSLANTSARTLGLHGIVLLLLALEMKRTRAKKKRREERKEKQTGRESNARPRRKRTIVKGKKHPPER